MEISNFYDSLGAPLRVPRQSWGAVHPDGTVYLSVWREDLKLVNGKRSVRLLLPPEKHHWGPTSGPGSHGYQQRQRHIDKIRNGSSCYCVLRWGRVNPPRDYEREFLLIGGKIHQDEETTYWLEIIGQWPVRAR